MRRPIYDYTYVDLPFAEAAELLGRPPTAWLPDPAEPDGGNYRVALDDGQGRAVDAAVSVGEARTDDRARTFVRPLSWEAAVVPGLFPRLVADLELTPLSRDRTQLTFVGSYRPPATVVGDIGDRVVGHRIAEAVVRHFLLTVAARLTDSHRRQESPTLTT